MRAALWCAIGAVFASPLHAAPFPPRSFSLSRQFVVYCDDRQARIDIASYADETKKSVLSLLGQRDGWKYPVVINVVNSAGIKEEASRVQLFETDEGFKVEFDVHLGADPLDVRFQQQLVRAILLEFAYRDRSAIQGGVMYAEPPPWLIEGIVGLGQHREAGGNVEVFKTLIATNRLPSLRTFLTQKAAALDTTSHSLYTACAMSLLQSLADLPDGRAGLASFIRDLATESTDTTAELMKHFPALGGSDQTAEKWWALSMARFSAADRYTGLSVEESDERLTPLLALQLPINKGGETKSFTLDRFKEYLKLRESRPALIQMSRSLLALQTSVNPLFRPIVFDYEKITADLARGKTRGVLERLEANSKYRREVLGRVTEIADYLNWFEATQMSTQTDAFAGYFRAAQELAAAPDKRPDAISQYIDAVETEFQ